jgi:hypothetical protein
MGAAIAWAAHLLGPAITLKEGDVVVSFTLEVQGEAQDGAAGPLRGVLIHAGGRGFKLEVWRTGVPSGGGSLPLPRTMHFRWRFGRLAISGHFAASTRRVRRRTGGLTLVWVHRDVRKLVDPLLPKLSSFLCGFQFFDCPLSHFSEPCGMGSISSYPSSLECILAQNQGGVSAGCLNRGDPFEGPYLAAQQFTPCCRGFRLVHGHFIRFGCVAHGLRGTRQCDNADESAIFANVERN